ncbi:hypothetical protein O0I10_007603 [Lichtheimia ornata]|uniref:Uncharacterized protein n=1 Tax=Lichtheimia ornata TaxID=688661 RepID=A0AAD7V303_9FUNG|nr:uncharacterized protein O0I10_007603 [Lichtheimia ornata]KAJ8656756.1 hypothetical protein O0I10_007603 [Lichtheimia ornata]
MSRTAQKIFFGRRRRRGRPPDPVWLVATLRNLGLASLIVKLSHKVQLAKPSTLLYSKPHVSFSELASSGRVRPNAEEWSVVGGWLLPWRYRCFLLFVAIPTLCLVSTEGKFGLNTLARLAFCFGSTTPHHDFRFPVTNNKGVLVYMEKVFGQAVQFRASSSLWVRLPACIKRSMTMAFWKSMVTVLRLVLSLEDFFS